MNTVFGQSLLDTLGPLVESDPDGVAVALCDATGAMVQRLDELVADTPEGPGLSMLIDPDRAPADWLGWMSALYGVTLVPGSSEADQRATIRDLPPQHRGTVDFMVAAIQQVLTGDKSVRVLERTGTSIEIDYSWDSMSGTWSTVGSATWDGLPPFTTTAYSLTVVLRASEVPDINVATAKALSAKPGGLDLTVSVEAEYSWDQSTGTWDSAGSTTWDQSSTIAV